MLVERKLDVAQEAYAAVTYMQASPVVVLSGSGGVDVEQACHESQEGVLVEPVNILRGLEPSRRPIWLAEPASTTVWPTFS